MQRRRWLLLLLLVVVLCVVHMHCYVVVQNGWYIRRRLGRPIVYRYVGNATNPFARPSKKTPIVVKVAPGTLAKAMGIFLRKVAETGMEEELRARRRYEHPKKRALRKQLRKIRLAKAIRTLQADSPQYLNVNPDYRFVGLRTESEKLLFPELVTFTSSGEEERKQKSKEEKRRLLELTCYDSDSVTSRKEFFSLSTREMLDLLAQYPWSSPDASATNFTDSSATAAESSAGE